MKNYYTKRLAGFFLLIIANVFVGCSEEQPYEDINKKQKVSISMTLSVPGLNTATTKAMSTAAESAIDEQSIQILVFEETGGVEIFRNQATITNRNLPQIILEMPVSSSGQKYRLVLLANAGQTTIAEGTLKEEALSKFTFDCLGKWNATSASPSKIPMWGELSETIAITNDRSVNILLHRALARVDVGLLFKFNNLDSNGNPYPQRDTDKESVYGLENFKIKDIRIYRTKSQAYVASSKEKMSGNEVIAPSIPTTAGYNTGSGTVATTLENADQDPLVYTLPAAGNSYIREIYIPESMIINAQSDMDNVPCLVVGGYYGAVNTSNITYYRADFATYNNGAVTAYRPILRNHQYVFDIRTVNGPGFPEPEQALRSISAPMELNVVEWNQVPLGFYVQGNYFLSVQEREIWIEARAMGGAAENKYVIPFQTNLDLDGSNGKSFDYVWESSGNPASLHFDITIDYTNKQFVFTPKSDNVNTGDDVRSDVISLTTENLNLTIKVNQKAFTLDYSLLCTDMQVHGKYREDVPLNYSHFITAKVITRNGNLNGSKYEIKTLEKNGVYFKAEGTFDGTKAVPLSGGDYEYTIKLEGYGTPVNEANTKVFEPFNVTIVSNSINNDYCATKIVIGYKGKRILTIGANAIYRYGYMLEPNTASRAFVDASVNFGVDPNSTVTMEENQYGNAFTIEMMTAGQGMIGEIIDYNYLKNKLNTFKPEIILTGQAVNYNASGGDAIQLLADFVEAGGVFLMCNEYYPIAGSVNAMVQKIMGAGVSGNNQSIGYTQLFTLNGDEDDMIANGPFGDMRGKYWGADGHEMHGFTSLPANETIVYSSRTDGYINMFRHADKPFFFMGEGGFISNPQRYIGNAYQGSYVYCPFAINSAYKPVPRVNFGLSSIGAPLYASVYNSQIFGNILAWAVDWSETEGIEYPDTSNKFP